MAKPVGARCNLACSYCYYRSAESADQSVSTDKTAVSIEYTAGAAAKAAASALYAPYADEPSLPRMTDDMLERYIRQYIEASPGPDIDFVWHGGEPTLAGLDFFRLALELQNRYLPESWVCRNNLQTNGLLLDDEWCAFLAQARFDVGLSIDGAQWIHDQYRLDLGGRGSYKAAQSSVRRLQAYGIKPDLLCTVTSVAAEKPLEVYRALRGLDTGWIQFIPIVRRTQDGDVTPDSVSGEAYGDFLCAVFDEWALRDIDKLDVQLFAETARVLSGGGAGLCWMAPECGRVLIVEKDGGVYSCDHFVTPQYRIGDIQTSHLRTLAHSPEQQAFGSSKHDRLPLRCLACPWLSMCNGGCPKDRFVPAPEGGEAFNYLCSGLQRYFSHAQPTLSMLLDLASQSHSLEDAKAALRVQEQAKWKGVGRNDPCPCGSGRKAKNCCWDKRP